MGNCQTAFGKSRSSSNEDRTRSDLKSSEESRGIVGDHEINKSPIEDEIDVSSSGSVAVSTNRELLTLILDSVAPLGVSNTELAEVEVGSISSSASSTSSGEVEEERRVVVDNGTVSVASNDSSASSVVIVEDISRQSEDDEIRDLRASNRNLHPSEGHLMEPTSESSLDESIVKSTSSSTEINNSNNNDGPVSAAAEKSRDDGRTTSPEMSLGVSSLSSSVSGTEEDSIAVSTESIAKDELLLSPLDTKEKDEHPGCCSPGKAIRDNPSHDTNQNIDFDTDDNAFVFSGKGIVPKNVQSVRIHFSVTKINDETFRECKQLKRVQFNQGLRRIGKNAFRECVSLGSITLPSTLLEIEHYAFKHCSSLREVVLNEGLTKIGSEVFQYDKALESITIPSTVIEIGHNAFNCCFKLSEVVLNECKRSYGISQLGRREFCYTNVKSNAFSKCTSLKSISLPSTLRWTASTFSQCNNLREVVLNEGSMSIGSRWNECAFSGSKSLEVIRLPSTLTSINAGTFKNCTKLREIVLNSGLKTIGTQAFEGCTSLESINIPNTITNIDASAFIGCNSLAEVVINERIQYTGANSPKICMPPYTELQSLSRCPSVQRFKFAFMSAGVTEITQDGYWSEILEKIDLVNVAFDGLIQRSGEELFFSAAVIRGNDNAWASVQANLIRILVLCGYYSIKEVTSMVELALWKSKINQASVDTDREARRVDMPGPAKDMILQYMVAPPTDSNIIDILGIV